MLYREKTFLENRRAKMVKCIELYEFLEKHGKICGMSDRALREGLAYYNEYRKEAEAKGVETILSEDAWKKAKRQLNERNGKNIPKVDSKESVVDESNECCCCCSSGELPKVAEDAVEEQIAKDSKRVEETKNTENKEFLDLMEESAENRRDTGILSTDKPEPSRDDLKFCRSYMLSTVEFFRYNKLDKDSVERAFKAALKKVYESGK